MIRELNEADVGDFKSLLQRYIEHIGDTDFTVCQLEEGIRTGIKSESRYVIGAYNTAFEPLGLLNYNPQIHRLSLFFANLNFAAERELFDRFFDIFSLDSPMIAFESGYPTPWISSEFSEYVIKSGFKKHDRRFMSLNRPESLACPLLPEGYHITPFSETDIEEVTRTVFKSVDGSADQELFPYVYGSFDSTLRFHQRVSAGDFGIHKPTYSWILKFGDDCIGACFMTTSEDHIGHVMHLAITPEFRRSGLGKSLLLHALKNLFKIEPDLKEIDLAVTLSNPARYLYESIGFKRVNDMSTYVWKNRDL